MIFVLCPPGHVATAVNDALESLDEAPRHVEPGGALVGQAAGSRAIVYAPEPRLLDAYDVPRPSTDRMRGVLRIAAAPGSSIERIVMIEPTDTSFVAEEKLLVSSGVPFTIVRCAPLVDELADATNLHISRPVWLEQGGEVELASRAALTRAVRSALVWDTLRGSTITVPAARMDIGEAMERAAAVAGAAVTIHVAAPGVSLSMRKLYAWLGVASLEVEAVCDRLVRRRRPAMA